MQLNPIKRRVTAWIRKHELELTDSKTEIVLPTKNHIELLCHLEIVNASVQVKEGVRYLGVMLNNKVTFGKQIRRAADKATAVTTLEG